MTIPFLVVDRPISLKIIKGSGYHKYKIRVGLMTHANTSKNFQELFRIYPCNPNGNCIFNVEKINCKYPKGICEIGRKIKRKTIKFSDSGVFTKEGCKKRNYEDLFEIYDYMGVKYGIMIDFLGDRNKTIESARKAMSIYSKGNYKFELYGVAQGKSVDEYLKCYKELGEMGFTHIAVGGLLKKVENSARYTKVRNEEEMFQILKEIKQKSPYSEYLFALGCYHPKRHEKFKQIKLYGADYKGWIFKYKNDLDSKTKEEKQIQRFNQVRDNLQINVFSKSIS